jgi:hypothetical protein
MSDSAKGQAIMTRLGRVVRTAGGPAQPTHPPRKTTSACLGQAPTPSSVRSASSSSLTPSAARFSRR